LLRCPYSLLRLGIKEQLSAAAQSWVVCRSDSSLQPATSRQFRGAFFFFGAACSVKAPYSIKSSSPPPTTTCRNGTDWSACVLDERTRLSERYLRKQKCSNSWNRTTKLSAHCKTR
jgi:hypothetical protein